MRWLSFAYDVRSIVANAIGRHLLTSAREGTFAGKPIVVILDEAHNFINRSIGEEGSKHPLDAFENIAREGRKFNHTMVFQTNRPRHLPERVITQMEPMLEHRLPKNRDRDVVEKASGDIDRAAASFLPSLSPGEAILLGTYFTFPLSIRIIPPVYPPDSKGPDFQACWAPACLKP
jgi:DNA helicase HerA-like ATPase